MKTNATSKKRSKTKKHKVAVLFGFCKNDKDIVGYFGKDLNIAEDLVDAKEFQLRGKKADGFATPEKWCKFINEDEDLSHGFKFHVIKCFSTES